MVQAHYVSSLLVNSDNSIKMHVRHGVLPAIAKEGTRYRPEVTYSLMNQLYQEPSLQKDPNVLKILMK